MAIQLGLQSLHADRQLRQPPPRSAYCSHAQHKHRCATCLAPALCDARHGSPTPPNLTHAAPLHVQALQVLDVSSNKLAGSLPQAWAASGRFPNMSVISLQANNLSGSVPASWGSPSYLTNLSQM